MDFILTTTEKGRFQSSCVQHSTIWPTGARWASWWAKRTRITSPCRCFMAIGARRRPMSSSISAPPSRATARWRCFISWASRPKLRPNYRNRNSQFRKKTSRTFMPVTAWGTAPREPLDQHAVELGEDREHHRRASLQRDPAPHRGLRRDRLQRGVEVSIVRVQQAYGAMVEGEALLSEEGFSPRYDLDRWSGIITRPGHRLEGMSIVDKVCFFPTAKGGIAAGWAFYDIKWKKIAPKAFIFGVTNPVMVQGAVFAGIPITAGWTPHPGEVFRSGDWVRVDPARKLIQAIEQT